MFAIDHENIAKRQERVIKAHTRPKIVILSRFEFRPERLPTGTAHHNRGLNDAISEKQHRGRILRRQSLRRGRHSPAFAKNIRPTKKDIETASIRHSLNLDFQTLRSGQVVRIKKRNVIRIAAGNAVVSRNCCALVGFVPHGFYSSVVFETLENLPTSIGRSVVHRDQLKVPKSLTKHAPDGLPKERSAVIDRHDERNTWHGRRLNKRKPSLKRRKRTN